MSLTRPHVTGMSVFILSLLSASAVWSRPAPQSQTFTVEDATLRPAVPGATPQVSAPPPATGGDLPVQSIDEPPPPLEDLPPVELILAPVPTPQEPEGPAPAVTVRTTIGPVGGEAVGDGTFAFKAIPFARPPVRELRWTAPQDPDPWTRTRFRTQSAPACLQVSYGWNERDASASSEDCLYLEIRTPDVSPGANLPVMVFIHGGANRAGSGAGTIYSGLPTRGVILVSIQYRLGVLGFMSHPALTVEGGGASGNYALMDQIKALQWVRDNIAAFGGDPSNVTLFGHSAGAQDVGLLMSSPLAAGLFHKAISQSGPPQFGVAPRTLSENEALGVQLAERFSMVGHEAPKSAEALADLRRIPPAQLQEAADELQPPIADKSFIWLQAIIDGRVLPRSPQEAFATGQAAKVPLIIGTSAQELGLYGGKGAVYPTLLREFGERDRFKVFTFYGLDVEDDPKPDPVLGDVAMQISTDLMMRCPVAWVASKMTGAGQPVYVYQLDVDHSGGPAHHGSELHYVFNALPEGANDPAWPRLLDHWAAFAKTRNPNAPGLALWASWGDGKTYLQFTASGPKTRFAPRRVVCDRIQRP